MDPGLSLTRAIVPFQLVMLAIGNAMTALEARRLILLNMPLRLAELTILICGQRVE
jgi:hypothetical protein